MSKEKSNLNAQAISAKPMLSSRSFWRENRLEAVDECKMELDSRPTLIIGKHYRPILVDLTEKEFCVWDDDIMPHRHTRHWFEWKSYEKYFKVVSVLQKGESQPKVEGNVEF